MDEQEQIRIRRQAEHDAAEIERTGTYEVLDSHPRPTRAQAMAAVDQFIKEIAAECDAKHSRAEYTAAIKVLTSARKAFSAIIEALTEEDES